MMARIAVVYHSGFGHTKVVGEHVLKGAAGVDGAEAVLIHVDELPPAEGGAYGGRWQELHDADAIIFGAPTYMGSISAGLKQVMESSSGLWAKQAWKDKIAAGFTNGGSLSGDKLNALTDLAVFAGQHSMIWVSQGLFESETNQAADDPAAVNRMGSWLGMMAQSDPVSPEDSPGAADRRTAELFGERVAQATLRWVRGG